MTVECKFRPLNFYWVALHPKPRGVIYFIGGAFFGSFPTISYNYLLRQLFEKEYTIIAIPYRFSFRHWTIAIEIFKDLNNIRDLLSAEAKSLGYDTTIYEQEPTSNRPNYFWVGHSLGCKYISLLEILTNVNSGNMNSILNKCGINNQDKTIKKALGDMELSKVSLLNQPSVFMAPVIAGIRNAIPFPPLANLLNSLGIDVQPNVQQTKCLILNSDMFNLLNIIAFDRDKRARDTVEWFAKNVTNIQRVIPLKNRSHLSPLGCQYGDDGIVKEVNDSLEELGNKLPG